VPPLFHTNVYPSGTIDHGYRTFAHSLAWPEPSQVAGQYHVGIRQADEWYQTLPIRSRIPIVSCLFPVRYITKFHVLTSIASQLLHACRLTMHFPEMEDPSQLDAYTLMK